MINKSFLKCLVDSWIGCSHRLSNLERIGATIPRAKAGTHKVIAYYFHTNTRCSTCMKIEAYSKEAIEQGFAE